MSLIWTSYAGTEPTVRCYRKEQKFVKQFVSVTGSISVSDSLIIRELKWWWNMTQLMSFSISGEVTDWDLVVPNTDSDCIEPFGWWREL